MSWLFSSGGQNIRTSDSAPVFPVNVQGWFPLGMTGLISYHPRGSQESSPAPQPKSINSSALRLLSVQLSHPYMTNIALTIALTIQIFISKVMTLLFNTLSRFVIALLPRSKRLLISLLNKQGNNIQLWYNPFSICDQSIVPCLILTVDSWPAYRFLRRQVRWSGIPISFRIFHSLLWST